MPFILDDFPPARITTANENDLIINLALDELNFSKTEPQLAVIHH